jgi:hypothetical protein
LRTTAMRTPGRSELGCCGLRSRPARDTYSLPVPMAARSPPLSRPNRVDPEKSDIARAGFDGVHGFRRGRISDNLGLHAKPRGKCANDLYEKYAIQISPQLASDRVLGVKRKEQCNPNFSGAHKVSDP